MFSVTNWLLFLLINALIVYSAYGAAAWFNRKEPSLATLVVATGIICYAQITITILFLGVVLQYLNEWSLILANVLVSGVLIYVLREMRKPLLQPATEALQQLMVRRERFLWLIVLLFAIQLIILVGKVVMLPPHIWDVFFYHLTPAVEWYQQGRIPLAIDTPAPHMNHVPLGMTVLSYWFFIFFHDDFLVELPMLLWALLLVPLIYTILRKAAVRPAWSLKFALLVFFIPIVLMQSITSKDHLGLNISLIAGLLFLANFLQTREYRQLILAALAFGLMLGYKSVAPVFLVVAAVLFLYLLYETQREVFSNRAERRQLIKTAGLSAVVLFAVGGYWYIKKLIFGGQLFGFLLPPQPVQYTDKVGHARFGLEGILINIQQFLPRVFDYRAPYGADLVGISGFGPQFAAFGLLALVVAIGALFSRRERARPGFLIVATATVLFLLFLLPQYSTNANSYRILSFLPMVMIAYAGILLHRNGFLNHRIPATVINGMMVAAIVWNMYNILPPQYTNPLRLKEFLSMDAAYRTSGNYTKWFAIHRPDMYHLLSTMPAEETIAIVSAPEFIALFPETGRQTWSYPYYDRHWRRKLVYFYQQGYLDCDQQRHCKPTERLKQQLHRRHIALVSACHANICAQLVDPDFVELAPGLFFYRGQV